jgi:hypothetical protein
MDIFPLHGKPRERQVAGTGKGSGADVLGRCFWRGGGRTDLLWPFGEAPFCFRGTAGLFAAWGPSMVMRAASILVVVLGLSPGGMAGEHAGVRHRMCIKQTASVQLER